MFTVGTTFGVVYAVTGRDYDIDAHAVGDVDTLLLPSADLIELEESSPDLMLTVLRRLVTGAFDSLDWVTRAMVTPIEPDHRRTPRPASEPSTVSAQIAANAVSSDAAQAPVASCRAPSDDRPEAGHRVAAGLHDRGQLPVLPQRPGAQHDDGEDHDEAAALRDAGQRAPQRPQVRGEQQAERHGRPTARR